MPTWIITGANRGLGLEFVRQLTTADTSEANTVIATVRSTSKTDLTSLSALTPDSKSSHTLSIQECDTSSATSISAFASALKSSFHPPRINFLLNNAGINAVFPQRALTLQAADLHSHIDTNVLGPALLTQQLLPLLAPGAVILNMTSGLGSFGMLEMTGVGTVYSVSKAALNMYSCHLATEKDIVDKKIRVLVMDPGHVKTEMGGPRAVLEKDHSIGLMLKTIREVAGDEAQVGKATFRKYDGERLPW